MPRIGWWKIYIDRTCFSRDMKIKSSIFVPIFLHVYYTDVCDRSGTLIIQSPIIQVLSKSLFFLLLNCTVALVNIPLFGTCFGYMSGLVSE